MNKHSNRERICLYKRISIPNPFFFLFGLNHKPMFAVGKYVSILLKEVGQCSLFRHKGTSVKHPLKIKLITHTKSLAITA